MHLKIHTTIIAILLPAFAAANPLADLVRETNDRFQDVNVAVAEGYGPIACADGRNGGSMGIHYVHGDYLMNDDNAIDVAKPEALMYEPQQDGSLVLVGLEYITLEGPASLEGHLFSYSGSPNRYGLPAFYELHVWAWRDNPKGMFTDTNPDVSCDFAPLTSN